ncbi:MAG: putative capsid protein [Pythion sobemo-like virus]|nr:MAG: putative capsid protein [Pythion sobemo-like virus]
MVKCNQCNRQFKTQAALNQHRQASHQPSANPPRRRAPARRTMPAQSNREGELVIGRQELLLSLEVKKDASESKQVVKLLPTETALTWLNKLAGNFDQIEWLSASLVWKPAVGTTFNGSLIIGVDWNAAANDAKRVVVQATVPHVDTPVWQQARLAMPANRLQSRKAYILKADAAVDSSPGVVLVNAKTNKVADDTFLGDLWLDYRVRLMGPSA